MKYLLSILVLLITYRSTANQCIIDAHYNWDRVVVVENDCEVYRSYLHILTSYLNKFQDNYMGSDDRLILSLSIYRPFGNPLFAKPSCFVGFIDRDYPDTITGHRIQQVLVVKMPSYTSSVKPVLNLIYYALENKKKIIQKQKANFFIREKFYGSVSINDNFVSSKSYDRDGYRYVWSIMQEEIDSVIKADIPLVDNFLAKRLYDTNTIVCLGDSISRYISNDSVYFYKGAVKGKYKEWYDYRYFDICDSLYREDVLVSTPNYIVALEDREGTSKVGYVIDEGWYLYDFVESAVYGPFKFPDWIYDNGIHLINDRGDNGYTYNREDSILSIEVFCYNIPYYSNKRKEHYIEYDLKSKEAYIDSVKSPDLYQYIKNIENEREMFWKKKAEHEQFVLWRVWFKVCTILTIVIVGSTGTYILFRKQ